MVESIAVAGYYVTLRCDAPLSCLESISFSSNTEISGLHNAHCEAPLFDPDPERAVGKGRGRGEANIS